MSAFRRSNLFIDPFVGSKCLTHKKLFQHQLLRVYLRDLCWVLFCVWIFSINCLNIFPSIYYKLSIFEENSGTPLLFNIILEILSSVWAYLVCCLRQKDMRKSSGVSYENSRYTMRWNKCISSWKKIFFLHSLNSFK